MTYNCKSEDCNGDCIDIADCVEFKIKYFKLQFKLLSYVAQFHPRYAPPPSLLSTSCDERYLDARADSADIGAV